MQSVVSCPICQRLKFIPFQTISDRQYEVEYVLCTTCGLVLQSPRMDPDELEAFYASAYRVHQQETEDPIEKDLHMQEARAERTLALIEHDLPQVRRHLDIGSSSGALLRAFQARYQCTGIGIEPGLAYREHSLDQGNQIYPDREALIEAHEARFDLISMMHVLEHLPDPIASLDQLRRDLLTSDGHLLVEVPNLYQHASFELAHLFAFSPQSLREVLRRAGYRVRWMRTHGSFRSPILKLYITALTTPQNESKPPHSFYFPGACGVGIRRKLGTVKRAFFTRYWPDWTWQSP